MVAVLPSVDDQFSWSAQVEAAVVETTVVVQHQFDRSIDVFPGVNMEADAVAQIPFGVFQAFRFIILDRVQANGFACVVFHKEFHVVSEFTPSINNTGANVAGFEDVGQTQLLNT